MSEPLYRFVPGAGIVSVRTDWTKSAAHLLMVCGIVTESHQDRAAGEFLLYQNDWLAGQAKAFSHSGIRQDCLDHNTISVDGQRQVQTHDGCRYLVQEDTPLYTFLHADLTAAYAGQLSGYHREMFWVKPSLLLVRDVFTPVNPAAVVQWNLNVLTQPVADITGGFAVTSDSGARLFGVAADGQFTAQKVPLEPNQTRPIYRLQVTGAGALRYCVGLEIATPTQAQRTVFPYAATALQGAVRGDVLVAAVTLPPPFTYASPVASGTHYLYGLKPSTAYTVDETGQPLIPVTTSPAGVLTYHGAPMGVSITVTEGSALPPPPPPPPPVPKGRTFSVYIPADNSAPTITETPSAARPEE